LLTKTGMHRTADDLKRTFLSAAPVAGVNQIVVKSLTNHLSGNTDVTEGYQSIDLDELRDNSQLVEDYLLIKAGMKDKNLDHVLIELISKLNDEEKSELIIQLSKQ